MVEIPFEYYNHTTYMDLHATELPTELRTDLETQGEHWHYVALRQFTRRLNRILHTTYIQQAYHDAAVAYSNVRRYEYMDLQNRHLGSNPVSWAQGEFLLPREADSCDWRYECVGAGRKPLFWDYTCHSACHWLSQPNLLVAQRLFPDINWSIASGPYHTTVLAPEERLLFDLNYLALEVPPIKAIELLLRELDEASGRTLYYEDGSQYNYLNGIAGPANEFFALVDSGDYSTNLIWEAVAVTKEEVAVAKTLKNNEPTQELTYA